MKKLFLTTIIFVGLLTAISAKNLGNAESLQCQDNPFRCKLQEKVQDGFYGVLHSGTLSPNYAIRVKNNVVIGDYTDIDDYGCGTRGCDPYISSGNNEYIVFNERQIIRKTPAGTKVVLTWYKALD